MSMYLSNADLGPVGAEVAEFIDDEPLLLEAPPEALGEGVAAG